MRIKGEAQEFLMIPLLRTKYDYSIKTSCRVGLSGLSFVSASWLDSYSHGRDLPKSVAAEHGLSKDFTTSRQYVSSKI